MNKAKFEFLSMYVNAKGNDVFRYKVTGSPEAMQAYEEAQGDYYRVDEETGNVLYFSSRFIGETGTLIINSENNKIYADMSEFKKVASLSSQFGGQLGAEIAKQAVGRLLGKSNPASVATKEAQTETSKGGRIDNI